jgi:hypothetical protein
MGVGGFSVVFRIQSVGKTLGNPCIIRWVLVALASYGAKPNTSN